MILLQQLANIMLFIKDYFGIALRENSQQCCKSDVICWDFGFWPFSYKFASRTGNRTLCSAYWRGCKQENIRAYCLRKYLVHCEALSLNSVVHKIQPVKRTRVFLSWFLKMRLLLAACFSANVLLLLIAMHGAESGTCDNTNVCTAIEALERKLEKLIALVTPPGTLGLTDLHYFFY